jgi:hypothetical protein
MIKRTAIALSSAALLAISSAAIASAEDEMSPEITAALATLDASLPGTLINNPYDIQWNTQGPDKRDSIVKSEGAPGGMAYRVTMKKKKKNHWDTAIRIPMTTSIEKDDVILMSFWARAAKPPKGRDAGDITATIQRNIDPYDSVIEQRLDIGPDWKLYSVSGKASRDYSADKTNINFNLAHAKQTLEFGQFYVMNLGKNADASKYTK